MIFKPKKQELVKLIQQMNETGRMSALGASGGFEETGDAGGLIPLEEFNANSEDNEQQIEFYDLVINSEKLTSGEHFNDYLVKLKNSYNNVVSFRLESFKLPQLYNNVNDDNNMLRYIYNGDERVIGLEPGLYDIDSIIKCLNIAFERNNDNLTVYEDNSHHITIKSKDKTNFELINEDNSLINVLGFKNQRYTDKYAYKSEEESEININDRVVLYLKMDDIEDTPLITVDLSQDSEEQCPVELSLIDNPLQDLNNFVIKFKNKDDTLFDFKGEPHELHFKIGILN